MNELKPFQPAYTRTKDLFSLLLLVIICLVCYWPLAFHVFSLKNDALTYFLPVRYQISQNFFNGYFPIWSPYFTGTRSAKAFLMAISPSGRLILTLGIPCMQICKAAYGIR
jgi:hypothetical protein